MENVVDLFKSKTNKNNSAYIKKTVCVTIWKILVNSLYILFYFYYIMILFYYFILHLNSKPGQLGLLKSFYL